MPMANQYQKLWQSVSQTLKVRNYFCDIYLVPLRILLKKSDAESFKEAFEDAQRGNATLIPSETKADAAEEPKKPSEPEPASEKKEEAATEETKPEEKAEESTEESAEAKAEEKAWKVISHVIHIGGVVSALCIVGV